MDATLELHVRVRFTPGNKTIRVLSDDAEYGCGEREFSSHLLPLQNQPANIVEWIYQAYKTWFPEDSTLQNLDFQAVSVGKALFKELFGGYDIQRILLMAWKRVNSKAGYRDILIRLDLPQELTGLPWELMHYDGPNESGIGRLTFLARSSKITLVRYLASDDDLQPQTIVLDSKLHLLGVVAQPKGWEFDSFNNETYHSYVDALKAHIDDKQVSIEWIEGANTLTHISRHIRGRVDVLDILENGRVPILS